MSSIPQNVLLAGATGLVGRSLLSLLLDDNDIAHVLAPARHALPRHPKLENPVGAASYLFAQIHGPLDTVFCCLGTTIRQAGSREGFHTVDHDWPIALGKHALALGARHYVVISALGAHPHSRVFYNRTKGETEAALRQQNWPRLTIVRPSLLLGSRKEFRLGERLAAPLMRLMPGRYRAIQASDVARAMWLLSRTPGDGVRVLESDELRELAR